MRYVWTTLLFLAALGCASGNRSDAVANSDADASVSSDGVASDLAALADLIAAKDLTSGADQVAGTDLGVADTITLPDVSGDSQVGAPSVVATVSGDYQRGPVRVHVTLSGFGSSPVALALAYATDGQTFTAASVLGPSNATNNSWNLVWDSFADVAKDVSSLQLRVSASVGQQNASTTLSPFALKNDPDAPRLVITTHSITTPDVSVHRAVPMLIAADRSVSKHGDALEVLEDPTRIVAHPTGRWFYVMGLSGDNSAVERLSVAGDATLSSAGLLKVPTTSISDVDVSDDGRLLFVLAGGTDSKTRGVMVFDLDHYGEIAGFVRRIDVNNPQNMTLFPGGLRMLMQAGVLGESDPFGLILTVDGATVYETTTDLGYNSYGPTISEDGSQAVLVNEDLFGSELMLLNVTSTAFSVPWRIDYAAVVDAVIVGDRVLVSRLDQNKVSVWQLGATALTGEQHITGISLASSMDVLRRGARHGTVVVSALTDLVLLAQQQDGSFAKSKTFDLGSGAPNIIDDIVVQP